MTDETPARRFVRGLVELGYEPNPGRSAEYIEYAKTYYSSEGEYVRVFLHFDKPVMGMTGFRLADVVIMRQRVLAPEPSQIDAYCPMVARDEVLSLVEALSSDIPQQAVDTRTCVQCGGESAEFYVVNDDAICYACVEARK